MTIDEKSQCEWRRLYKKCVYAAKYENKDKTILCITNNKIDNEYAIKLSHGNGDDPVNMIANEHNVNKQAHKHVRLKLTYVCLFS